MDWDVILSYINQYAAMALLCLFAVFVLIGLLVGWRRGWKRSSIRFATLLVFIGGLFLLTPLIGQWIYNMPFEIAGRKISGDDGWAEYGIHSLINSMGLEEYWPTVDTAMDEMVVLRNFMFGIVFALTNIILFLFLYFIVKSISHIIYSIIAKYAAPKYKKHEVTVEGKKKPKIEKEKIKRTKADFFGGMAIGTLTGAMLFFFVMVPLNGLLIMTNSIVKASQKQEVQTQSADSSEIIKYFQDIDNCFFGGGNTWAKTYNKVMTFTGIKSLSAVAFDYQTSIKLTETQSTSLIDTVVETFPLYEDFVVLQDRLAEIDNDPARMTDKDISMVHNFINEVFDYNLVKDVINPSVSDLHNMLEKGIPFKDTTLNYRKITDVLDSWGLVGENKEQFTVGISALFNALKTNTTELIRDIADNLIDIVQFVYVPPAGQTQSLMSRLDSADLSAVTAVLNETASGSNKTNFSKLTDLILENRLFEIIGAADVELVVTNSSFVESFAGQDKEQFAVGVSALVNELKTDTTKMIRDTANNIFDIAQFAYLTSEGQTQPLMSRLNSSDPNELLKVLSETSDDGNKTNLGKLTDIILQNKLFDIVGAPNVELAITKSRFFDDFVNEFGEDKAQFAVGANAFVNSLRTDISGTLRNVTNNVTDVYNFLNHIPEGQTQTILSRLDLSDQWEFITVLNEVYPDGNNKTNLGKLTDIILQNKLFDIISAPNAEKAVINSIFVDDLGKSGWDTTLVKQDLETLLGTTKNGKTAREKWKELFATIDKSVGVIAELRTAPDLIEEYEKNGDVDRGDMLPKDDAVNAMLYYIKNDLTDPTIDDLAAALHDLAFSFNSIRKFIDDMLLDFDVSEYSLYDQNDKPIVDVEEFKKGLVDGMFGEYDESSKQFITDPDKDAWVSRIKSIQQVASSVLSFKTMQSGDVGGMLETLLTGGSELVDLIANDQTVANIVGNIIESQMEELSKDSPISISLPKDGDNNYDKEAIAEVANIMTDLVTSAAAAMESSEPIDLTEMVDDKKDELLSLANSGVVITVDDTVPDGEEQSSLDKIADTITNLEDITEDEKNALRNLFGIK